MISITLTFSEDLIEIAKYDPEETIETIKNLISTVRLETMAEMLVEHLNKGKNIDSIDLILTPVPEESSVVTH